MKKIKFLTDSMFGKLTRLLRIFGYDTVYANDLESYFNQNPVSDDKLLEFAIKDDRIIITRDYPFYKRAENKCIYLDEWDTYICLSQLKKKIELKYDFKIENARCSICNSELKKVENKNLVKNKLKLETYKFYNDFYQCNNSDCKKIYWKGKHIEDIIKKIGKQI